MAEGAETRLLHALLRAEKQMRAEDKRQIERLQRRIEQCCEDHAVPVAHWTDYLGKPFANDA